PLGLAPLPEFDSGRRDRPHSRRRRPGPEGAALLANEIPEPLQRAGEAQDRALVETRCRRDLAEHHRRLVGMERVEHGERAFDRLDPVFAHPDHLLRGYLVLEHNRTQLRCTERYAMQKNILSDRTSLSAGMAGLLAGTRVLDLTNVLAGPFCCYQLAQLGAEVIKVEVPGTGDLARQLGADPELNRRGMGASFLAQNAGKRSITLNLKSPKG